MSSGHSSSIESTTKQPTLPTRPHILFLTTHLDSRNWNLELLPALKSRDINFSVISYLDSTSKDRDPEVLTNTYTHISLLLLGEYPPHYFTLVPFLKRNLPAARIIKSDLHIFPGPQTTLWNAEKTYLRDLGNAGFPIPDTLILPHNQTAADLELGLQRSGFGRAVVKPSIGASGVWTHLVHDTATLTDEDKRFLEQFVNFTQDEAKFYGNIMLQAFIPEIVNGEYSLVIVGKRHLFTVLKRPRAKGWQVNTEHGGAYAVILEPDVPEDAKRVAREVVQWLRQERFPREELAYARIDGVVREDGKFVIMEVELLEPSLFLGLEEGGVGQLALDALCGIFADGCSNS